MFLTELGCPFTMIRSKKVSQLAKVSYPSVISLGVVITRFCVITTTTTATIPRTVMRAPGRPRGHNMKIRRNTGRRLSCVRAEKPTMGLGRVQSTRR